MKNVGIIRFPGSLDDKDVIKAIKYIGCSYTILKHTDTSINNIDCVIIPGGFTYGDYLRCGAIASKTLIMRTLYKVASSTDIPILGICNGFQILCETALLPGILRQNKNSKFICNEQNISVNILNNQYWLSFIDDMHIKLPLKSGYGMYYIDNNSLNALIDNKQNIFTYINNPNGSLNSIAGIINRRGNILGIMPHPEYAIDYRYHCSIDGLKIFLSILRM